MGSNVAACNSKVTPCMNTALFLFVILGFLFVSNPFPITFSYEGFGPPVTGLKMVFFPFRNVILYILFITIIYIIYTSLIISIFFIWIFTLLRWIGTAVIHVDYDWFEMRDIFGQFIFLPVVVFNFLCVFNAFFSEFGFLLSFLNRKPKPLTIFKSVDNDISAKSIIFSNNFWWRFLMVGNALFM